VASVLDAASPGTDAKASHGDSREREPRKGPP
jgi:hypothetical protein